MDKFVTKEDTNCFPQKGASSHSLPDGAQAGTIRAGAPLIHFRFPGVENVKCLFSTALFGNLAFYDGILPEEAEAVQERRHKLFSRAGISRWAELKQVHGRLLLPHALASDPKEPGTVEGDGHATNESGLALAIKTADCQPVLIAHKSGKCVAALHVGWRANANWFIPQAIDEFCHVHNVRPDELFAVRGPSLGPGVAQFVNFAREWGPDFSLWYDAHSRTMDLWRLTRHQLTMAGLREKSIFSLDLCTYSLPSLFFSYRQKHTGRQVGLIWRE